MKPEELMINVPPMPEKGKWHRNWFSNMLPFDDPLIYQNIYYISVENFYQAMKLPKDRLDLREQIAKISPQKSKIEIRNQDKYKIDPEWNKEKSLKVMEFALRHKFYPGTSWHEKLMQTGDEEIIEWNNWGDVFWGKTISNQKGQNHLGKLLMKLRNEYAKTKRITKSSKILGIPCFRGTIFGNPYTHLKDKKTKAEFIVSSREESLDKFREYFNNRVAKDSVFKKAVLNLRGEKLICYCDKHEDCHVDIIIKWLFKNI